MIHNASDEVFTNPGLRIKKSLSAVLRLCGLLLACCSTTVQAHTHGVLMAAQAEQAPVIDGDLGDWRGFVERLDTSKPDWFMGPSRMEFIPVKGENDIKAWFSACWTEDRLYLAVLVVDDVVVKNASSEPEAADTKADCVDWYLDLNHDAPYFIESRAPSYRADDIRVRMIPFEKDAGVKGGFFLVNQGGSLMGYRSFQRYTRFASRPVTVGGWNGYAMEASLDLKKLGFPGLTRPGNLMGLDVSVHDADSAAGGDRTLTWSSWSGRALRDSSSFGDLIMTDAQGAFPISTNQMSTEEAGYYLHPGRPIPAPFLKAVTSAPPGPEGRVVWSSSRIPRCSNLTGLFDPNPYRPLNQPAIRYCQAGYLVDSRKVAFLETAVGEGPGGEVFTLTQDGKPVLRRPFVKWGTLWNRDYYLLNFSACPVTGRGFVLEAGSAKTAQFPIKKGVYDTAVTYTLRGFFQAQRCGKAAAPYHGECHRDDAYPAPHDAEVDRQPILQFPPAYGTEEHQDVSGGFHDDGHTGKNMSRFPVALGLMLLTAEEFNPKLDSDRDHTTDVIEWLQEALSWGLKMQDKDGGMFERVVDAGDKRYLDTDKWADVTARWVAMAALGAHVLERRDPRLSAQLEQSALRGWAFVSRNQNQPARPCMKGCYPENPASLFWAAVELHRLTLEPIYLEAALKRLPSVLEGELEPTSWRGSQVLALLRLYPILPENQAKAKIRRALTNHLMNLRNAARQNPFGVRYVAGTEEGNSGTLLATAVEIYFLGKVFPKLDVLSLIEPYRQWVYGANPAGYSFVVGKGYRTPHHQVTWLKVDLPGSVVPGVLDDGLGFPLYLDFDTFRQANEASLDAAAANLFLAFVRAPWKVELNPQDEGESDAETLRATEKPPRPPEGAVLDFNAFSAGSFWMNGSGDWSVKNSMVPTEEGRTFRCDFKTGEWAVTGIPLEGDWTAYKGLSFVIRGSNAHLRVVVNDPDDEDWAKEITAPASWKAVPVYFQDMKKPPWKERMGNDTRDFGGPKTLKLQVLEPEKGWFEIVELNLIK